MGKNSVMWLRLVVGGIFAVRVASDQLKCYYPNGNAAPDSEKPCSAANGSACCPDKWQCLDNGLCYLPAGNLYGRYSCSDPMWDSPGCPANLCVYDTSRGGGESITQCSQHNGWCCNGDAVHVNCCQESPSPRPFFSLGDGKAYATVGWDRAPSNPVLSTITGLASSMGSQSMGTGLIQGTTVQTTLQGFSWPHSTAPPFTSLQTSISSGSAGIQTVVNTVVVTQTAAPNNQSSKPKGKSSSIVGTIAGGVVGAVVAIALAGIVFWVLHKRRHQKGQSFKETGNVDGEGSGSPGSASGAAATLGKKQSYPHAIPGTPEIDGHPTGPGRPISAVKGHAELESGTVFLPGQSTPYTADTVGLGGGNSGSPAVNQAGFSRPTDIAELDSRAILPPIAEKAENEQQLQAHGPPNGQEPAEETEKQLQK